MLIKHYTSCEADSRGKHMDKGKLAEIFEAANASVSKLPEHLQAKAFEIAVDLLSGSRGALAVPSPGAPLVARQKAPRVESDGPDVSDLLKVCKRNPDRYVVFLHDAEESGDAATVESLKQAFKTYKQDVPKLPNRDLDELVAKGWVEKDRSNNPLSFTLKSKGRSRLAELVAAARES